MKFFRYFTITTIFLLCHVSILIGHVRVINKANYAVFYSISYVDSGRQRVVKAVEVMPSRKADIYYSPGAPVMAKVQILHSMTSRVTLHIHELRPTHNYLLIIKGNFKKPWYEYKLTGVGYPGFPEYSEHL